MPARLPPKALPRTATTRPGKAAAPAASPLPKWRAAIYTAGFTAVGVTGVWAGVSLKDEHDQRSAQKKLFQEKGIEDDTEKRIALLEQRKAHLKTIKQDIEKKAAKIQDRMDGKEQRQPQGLVSRQSVWKED